MSATGATQPAPRFVISVETLRLKLLWLTVFSSFFVMQEPSPYELLSILTLAVFLVTGLTFARELLPLIGLLLLYHLGAGIVLIKVAHLPNTIVWTLVGVFLAINGIFFALVVAERPLERLDVIMRAYVAAAVVVSALAVLGYFRLLPFSDSLLLYGRAKGTFKDPNVFGPFLVLPAVYLLQRILLEGSRAGLRTLLALLVIAAAVFLSFSRGAWGHLAGSGALMALMTFLVVGRPSDRARIVLLAILGVILLGLLIVGLLSIPAVESLFRERASLEQSYDLGQFGRFNRWILGFQLAFDEPFGIGMLQFGKRFGEDTHNSYLNAFMSYGWLGGIVFPTIVGLSLFVGYRTVFVPAPWRFAYICVLSTFTVVMAEAWIIDVDHWRHVYLLLGLVWGLGIASARWQRRQAPSRPRLQPALSRK